MERVTAFQCSTCSNVYLELEEAEQCCPRVAVVQAYICSDCDRVFSKEFICNCGEEK